MHRIRGLGRGPATGSEFDSDPDDGFEDLSPIDQGDAGAEGAAGSNPLASVTKVEFIWQYKKTTNRKHVDDFQVKASKMLMPQLKMNVELHYRETNVTGSSERDWKNETWPASAEFEAGKMLTPAMGVFVQALAGVGGERPFTYGVAPGLRVNF